MPVAPDLNVAVIGTGHVGLTLSHCWAAAGLAVRIGSRDPDAVHPQDIPSSAEVQLVAEAVDAADVVVLAVPNAAVPGLLADNAAELTGRILIDATNRVGGMVMHNAELAEELVPGAAYVRAFNSVGYEVMARPVIDGQRVDMFYTSPPTARHTTEQLIEAVGLRPIWLGEGRRMADMLDSITRLWFHLALQQGRGRHIGLRLLP